MQWVSGDSGDRDMLVGCVWAVARYLQVLLGFYSNLWPQNESSLANLKLNRSNPKMRLCQLLDGSRCLKTLHVPAAAPGDELKRRESDFYVFAIIDSLL